MTVQMQRGDRLRRGKVRLVSIRGLLEWAFQRELASLDFNEVQSSSGWLPSSVSMEYRMMEQAKLGCRVDGGGRSDPHPDADIVVSALAALPQALGGRRTAMWIAELARAGREPDWMPDARPRLVPGDTHTNRHGTFARTEDAAGLGAAGWPRQPRRNRKGVVVYDRVLFCPARWYPTGSQIAAARRAYLQWWSVLLELRNTFQIHNNLSAHVVTDDMPVMSPWKKALTKS